MERILTALLGPTNTGKTYLAVEKMLTHKSGMIGFPLRLLARENYDRIARLKGAENVALITGEEKIMPLKFQGQDKYPAVPPILTQKRPLCLHKYAAPTDNGVGARR